MFICIYCKNKLNSKASLTSHLKIAKFCKNKREEQGITITNHLELVEIVMNGQDSILAEMESVEDTPKTEVVSSPVHAPRESLEELLYPEDMIKKEDTVIKNIITEIEPVKESCDLTVNNDVTEIINESPPKPVKKPKKVKKKATPEKTSPPVIKSVSPKKLSPLVVKKTDDLPPSLSELTDLLAVDLCESDIED